MVYRRDDVVHTQWPQHRVVRVEERTLVNSFPAVLQGGDDRIAEFYEVREQGIERNDLLDRLAKDERIPLDRPALEELLADPRAFTGLAGEQVAAVVERITGVLARFPEDTGYSPAPIL